MAIPAYDIVNLLTQDDKYTAFIAEDEHIKQLCYKLRYDVFAKEPDTDLSIENRSIDKDRFDEHCQHLVIFNHQNNEIIATTRLLDNNGRNQVGMFYSETEFDLMNIITPEINFIEVGRTCIHPAYRQENVLATLWRGIAELLISNKIDYLMGSASIPLSNGDKYISSVMSHIYQHHYAPEHLRVQPLVPLRLNKNQAHADDAILPILLKDYVQQGALVCGQPYWDAAIGVADVFILLEAGKIVSRYSKHPVISNDQRIINYISSTGYVAH